MNLEKKLYKVINREAFIQQGQPFKIDRLVKAIVGLLSSELPKEISEGTLTEHSFAYYEKVTGYNQCLSDIKKKWGINVATS